MAGEEVAQKEAAPVTNKGSKKMMIIGGIVAGVLLVEGAGIFLAVKMLNKGPAEAVGFEAPEKESQHEEAVDPNEKTEEVIIANQFECPHTNTGRLYVIRMTVYATVPASLVGGGAPKEGGKSEGHGEAKEGEAKTGGGITEEVAKNIATIKDRMRTVIAGADASTLCLARSEKPDYGLSTLRRQFKTILDEVLGKGKVKDVLVSDYMPTPMD